MVPDEGVGGLAGGVGAIGVRPITGTERERRVLYEPESGGSIAGVAVAVHKRYDHSVAGTRRPSGDLVSRRASVLDVIFVLRAMRIPSPRANVLGVL